MQVNQSCRGVYVGEWQGEKGGGVGVGGCMGAAVCGWGISTGGGMSSSFEELGTNRNGARPSCPTLGGPLHPPRPLPDPPTASSTHPTIHSTTAWSRYKAGAGPHTRIWTHTTPSPTELAKLFITHRIKSPTNPHPRVHSHTPPFPTGSASPGLVERGKRGAPTSRADRSFSFPQPPPPHHPSPQHPNPPSPNTPTKP